MVLATLWYQSTSTPSPKGAKTPERGSAAKAVGKHNAGIRGCSYTYYFLDAGGIEIFRCLLRVSAGEKEIDPRVQATTEERSYDSAAKLLHGSSNALGAQNSRAAARSERFRSNKFEFTPSLQVKGQSLSCSQQIENGP